MKRRRRRRWRRSRRSRRRRRRRRSMGDEDEEARTEGWGKVRHITHWEELCAEEGQARDKKR
jgi:hypothetical protein